MHQYQDLIHVFNDCFATQYNTKLEKGGDEPLYLPAHGNQACHVLFFAHGFFSSALHECAHWLIAGPRRRLQVDFGYWYSPDGRSPSEQKLFQTLEVKPQALEWILSKAANHRFRVSIDNLNGGESDTQAFKEAIYHQVIQYCEQGLSDRAEQFRTALARFYKTPLGLRGKDFEIEMLG